MECGRELGKRHKITTCPRGKLHLPKIDFGSYPYASKRWDTAFGVMICQER